MRWVPAVLPRKPQYLLGLTHVANVMQICILNQQILNISDFHCKSQKVSQCHYFLCSKPVKGAEPGGFMAPYAGVERWDWVLSWYLTWGQTDLHLSDSVEVRLPSPDYSCGSVVAGCLWCMSPPVSHHYAWVISRVQILYCTVGAFDAALSS